METWTAEQYRDYLNGPKKPKRKSLKPSGLKPTKPDLFCKAVQDNFSLNIIPEYKFHATRRWRFDYAIPHLKLAIEVEGGIWTQGRHTRGAGFLGDMEKYNAAAAAGWTLYRTTPKKLMSAETFDMIKLHASK